MHNYSGVSQISICFRSTTNRFQVTGYIRRLVHRMTPKWQGRSWVKVPRLCSNSTITPRTNFAQFRRTAGGFRGIDHFKTSELNDPIETPNTTRSKVVHVCSTINHESQMSILFTLQPATKHHVRVTGNFQISSPNDPSSTLNSARLKVPPYML